ncbi:MAG: hypothetical protein HOE48_23320 [Candidatus Latescibacteria bacterium]|jgi:hypothetical protein|nr:hypothetical protein [Candidatus Latescibacterota bacterium]MBT4140862.1 hypothetical protein [Candidatus Latescibacterota bacterium]MBT5832879.1 hypothetical protein [Candidatus Latescibacterota bacterium]
MIAGLGNVHTDCLNQALEFAKDATADIAVLSQKRDDSNVMGFLDDVLDLSDGKSLMGALGDLSPENVDGALKSFGKLLQAGVVGYEYRKVNGEVRKVFIDVGMGSDLHRAPLARDDERFDRLA